MLTIAIDAAGGDFAPAAVLLGASACLSRIIQLKQKSDVSFQFFGNPEIIQPFLDNDPLLKKYSKIVEAYLDIQPSMSLSDVVRKGPHTTLGKAILAVVNKTADAVVSSGSTGPFMALSKIYMKTYNGIDRPAIPVVLPTLKGKCLMLDMGANIDCTSKMLCQFARMGNIYAKAVLKIENPRIGILNIGSEETKGKSYLHEAAKVLFDDSTINYIGFVEGTDIFTGSVDVIVTDGFTGNVTLKTAEGTAQFINGLLKQALSNSFLGKLGYLLARNSLKKVYKTIDKKMYNGAPFLGLKGIAVKSHGASDAIAFSYALDAAIEMVRSQIPSLIEEQLLLEA